ncbi:exodeoxyribonuclease VII small subunit [Ahniella affigens]|uniref:Exodeoxyribonuclease 7 small subunit n=1 Tax=Ahniella affigens TaxID=2021234 RepID=A0A2P1PTW3_9GAMM|nr:exodeoxyribonuclease VII small subunit [Ahniella affigens]AVP98284.1 exodeoxyribonuclease VII small subunit [Ahniella affigens]
MSHTEPLAPQAFESALRELEQLVQQLQAGQMPLQESLQAFERGIGLYRQCQGLLEQAELKIRQIQEHDLNAGPTASPDAS